ncbi:MAG: hypothetical protein AB1425_02680 [Actinomycetota bacterium]
MTATLRHEEFAERAAERLEVAACELERQGRALGFGERVLARARELRIAAFIVRDEAAAVSGEEGAERQSVRRCSRAPG